MGDTIVSPVQLNLSQDQRVALEAEILKRERIGKDGKAVGVYLNGKLSPLFFA